jgi:TfoX/Sxy family transcriptional regulator of competence genes
MRRRRGSGMERWMDGRERDVFYITIAFLEDSFCRGKRRSENGEREREKEERREKKRKTGERKTSGPDENREALFACFGVVTCERETGRV